jgi:hypothetical protein
MPIREANAALQAFEAVLTLGDGREATKELLATIEGYNRDDCVSAVRLREWLEERTDLALSQGNWHTGSRTNALTRSWNQL